MPKYNIALIPTNNTKQFFDYFEKISIVIKPYKYRLGTSTGESQPHVTLCQFTAASKELNAIWEKVNKLPLLSLNLIFDKQRTKTYPKETGWEEVSWISLICENQNEILKKLHLAVAKIVTPTNAAFDNYDPHLTLMNSLISEKECRGKIDRMPNIHQPLTDKFIVALGESDDSGQLTKILYNSI